MTVEPSFDFTNYWRMLRRRLWLLVIPVVAMTGVLGAGSFMLEHVYRVTADVVVRQEMDPAKGLAVDTQITQQLGGVIETMQQPQTEMAIYEKLKPVVPAGVTLQAALNDFRDNLRIRSRESGRVLLVDFTYDGQPKNYAVEVVNAFADEFQAQGTKLVANSLVLSLEFVEGQLKDQAKTLSDLDEKQRLVQDKLAKVLGDLVPGAGPTDLTKTVSAKLTQGESDLQKLTLDIKSTEAQAKFLRAQLGVTKPTLELRSGGGGGGDPTEAALEQLAAETQSKLTALQMKYTDQHPEVVVLRHQLTELRRRQAQRKKGGAGTDKRDEPNPAYESLRKDTMQAEAQLEFMRSEQKELTERNAQLRKVSSQLPTFEDQLGSIQQQRDATHKTYDSLLQRRQTLLLNQSFEQNQNTGRFEVHHAGGAPLQPIRPNRKRFVLMGFGAGLLIGLAFMFLAEYLDHAVRTTDNLRRYVDAPLLAVLPRIPR